VMQPSSLINVCYGTVSQQISDGSHDSSRMKFIILTVHSTNCKPYTGLPCVRGTCTTPIKK
jgi:hypothetical protein